MCHVAIAEDRWLRLLDAADTEELHEVIEANRDHLARWMPWAATQTLADTAAFIARTREQLDGNNGFQVAVIEAERIVGVAGFHGISWSNRSTSLGYWIAEPAQGRGTITLTVHALLDHAFGAWQLHRVEIRAASENHRSRAIPQRIGFQEEGVLRQAERIGERYVDLILYATLAGDRSNA